MPGTNDSAVLKWKPHFIRAAKCFYDEICSINDEHSKLVEYHEEAFDKIFQKYLAYREKFHNLLEGRRMDRHKILAALLLALIDKDNQIFRVNMDAVSHSSLKEFSTFVMQPNEIFICNILIGILTEYVLSTKKSKKFNLKIENYYIRLPDKAICWEIGSSKPYFDYLINLLLLLKIMDNDTKYLHTVSHLFFFFELAYDCAVAELNGEYYNIAGHADGKPDKHS